MNRLEQLKALYEVAQASISEVDPDKRSSLIREARFLLLEIQELEAGLPVEGPVNPLDELRKRREKRSA